ncbi:MAG TPA: hypothetical protein VF230_04320 [Acidimicrobiales bacterium]
MAKHPRPVAAVATAFGAAVVFLVSLASSAAPADAQEVDELYSTIEIVINATGGDAIDFYSHGFSGDAHAFMDEIGAALVRVPWDGTTSDYRDVYDDLRTAGLQLDGRVLARESSGDLVLRVDTRALNELMSGVGYQGYELGICAPRVDREIVGEGLDEPSYEVDGCSYWQLTALPGAHVEFEVRVRPDADGYGVLVATLAAVAALATVAGILGVRLLRRSVLRSFGAPSVAIAAAAVLASLFVTVVAVITLTVTDGPTTGLVMAREVAQWGNVVATVLPASFLAVPGLVIAVLALRSPVVPKPPAPPAFGGYGQGGYGGYGGGYGGYGAGGYPQAPPPPPPSTPGPGMPTWLGK